MRFAHLADVHIGAWREPRLKTAATFALDKAIAICIENKVDFILIAGDLLNTSLPSVDMLKSLVLKIIELKKKNIPIYIIPGSHDFSPSGKTMLDVLEAAGLVKNVAKGEDKDGKLKLRFTIDEKTGAKITGIIGRRGMLDKKFYENLDTDNLQKEKGFKIFMFHTAISEFKPKDMGQMESMPMSYLPRGFDYYAGGHVHSMLNQDVPSHGKVAMPGPLFPCNFKELEKQKRGGFFIYDDKDGLLWVPIELYKVCPLTIECDEKKPEQVVTKIRELIRKEDFKDTIVTLRFKGKLDCSRITEIDFKGIFNGIYEKGAFLVLKNTSSLTTKEFEEIKVNLDSVNEIEDSIIQEHLGSVPLPKIRSEHEFSLIKELLMSFDLEKDEGETTTDFSDRVVSSADKVIQEHDNEHNGRLCRKVQNIESLSRKA